MADDNTRPRPATPAPDVEGFSEARIAELVQIEEERLARALELEKDRDFVFPETTVILKDLANLARALDAKRAEATSPETMETDTGDGDFGSFGDLDGLIEAAGQ